MSSQPNVVCVHCDAKFGLKNRTFLGKKLRCPKCSRVFTAEEAVEDDILDLSPPPKKSRPPVDEEIFDDDDGEAEVDVEVESRSAKPKYALGAGAKGKGAKRRPKSSNGQGLTIALMAGGGVVALLLVGFLIWGVTHLVGGSSAKLDLAYQSPETESILQINVAKVWNSDVMQKDALVSGLRQQVLDHLQKGLNLQPTQVQRLTLGVSQLADSQIHFIMVIRTELPLEASRLFPEPAWTKSEVSGKPYYKRDVQGKPLAAFLGDDKTLVAGSDADLQAAVARGPKGTLHQDFSWVDHEQDYVYTLIPKDVAAAKNSRLGFKLVIPDVNHDNNPPLKDFEQTVIGYSLGFKLDSSVNGLVRFRLKSPADADRFGKAYEMGLKQLVAEQSAESDRALAALKTNRSAQQKAQTDQRFDRAVYLQGFFAKFQTEIKKDLVEVKAGFPLHKVLLDERMQANLLSITQFVTPFGGGPGAGTAPPAGGPAGSGGGDLPALPDDALDPNIPKTPPDSGPVIPSQIVSRGTSVSFVLEGYTGTGSSTEAAQNALRKVAWVRPGSVRVDDGMRIIVMEAFRGAIATEPAKQALEQAGFRVGMVSVRSR